MSLDRNRILLATAGAAWLLTQYVAVREIGSTFFSTELVILGAVVVTMLGPSIAYAVADRLDAWLLTFWGLVSVATHLALPVGLRALVGAFAARGVEAWALGLTVGVGSLVLCGFYAVFLPRCARAPESLPGLYCTELVGALMALPVLLLAPSWQFTLAAYWLVAIAVIHLGVRRIALTGAVTVAAGLLFAWYPALDRASAEIFLRGSHGHEQPEVIATVYSPYQRIDVVDDTWGRSLYLDGVPFFDAGDLTAFNVFMADVPGALHGGGGTALVIGSGSFASAGFAKRRGYDVTVVELDPEVARLGFAHFAPVHRLQRGDVRVVIDDGRSFLARQPHDFYDLIVLDVPAPYHVQTALLHTQSFYQLVASRLRPGGVAAISLSDYLDGEVGRAIAAAAAAAFRDIVAVDSEAADLTVLYASDALPFAADAIRAELASRGHNGAVWDAAGVRDRIAESAPLTVARLGIVLIMARDALPDSNRDPETEAAPDTGGTDDGANDGANDGIDDDIDEGTDDGTDDGAGNRAGTEHDG